MQTLKINAAEKNKGERLDKFIADNSDISRSYAAKLCEDGFVLCGEKQLLKKYFGYGGNNDKCTRTRRTFY